MVGCLMDDSSDVFDGSLGWFLAPYIFSIILVLVTVLLSLSESGDFYRVANSSISWSIHSSLELSSICLPCS